MRNTLLPLLFAGALATGCDSSSGEGANPVSVRFATMPGAAALGKTAADEIVIAGTNGKLTITDVRFIVSKFKLEDESLACEHGDEGEDDRGGRRGDDDRRDGHDDDDDGCGEFESDPFFVDLPLTTGTVSVATTAIPAGSYSKLEFRIKDINLDASDRDDDDERGDDSADDDAALRAVAAEVRAAFPQWPRDASLVVTGTFLPAGSTTARPFTSFFEAEVRVERRLVPPLTVDGPTTLTLDVDPRAWFLASGAALDLSAFDYARTGRVVEFKTRVRDGFVRVRHGD